MRQHSHRPDVRMQDSPSMHAHPHALAPHAHANGAANVPSTPGGLSNGSSHHLVSPATAPAPVANGAAPPAPPAASSIIHKLAVANEQTWLLIGRVAEQMGDLEHALSAYENALRHNPMSMPGLTQVAGIARIKENYPKAVEYFQRVLSIEEENGEIWSALGHCYLMQDDLQKAYSAYQQALYLLPNPKEDPKLWYGIGILYDRYGSLDHAEEAFASVLRMDKDLDFDKENEILFRLGIIYKQQSKYDESLVCFDRILRNPPSPLAHADIWFQIGHVYEQQKDHKQAKDAYEKVVRDNPAHAKVLQQLGWLYHQDGSSFQNQDLAIQYLTKSLEADSQDAQSWYLLGRAYMAGQKYNKAYEAYQQAVYRDGRNPTFWCSIGVLYFQINQFRDALDAYSRAIRINPYISEVWFDLGSLYESCNNQISDAIDAYARASELDPQNTVISQRLQLLRNAQATGSQLPAAPGPQDVHPTAYASAVVPPPGLTGPPLMLQSSANRPIFRTESRGPPGDASLPLPPPLALGTGRTSPGPFRGGPPPPVILDESRHAPSHTPLAPMMDGDRDRERYPPRSERAPGPHSLLLHQPVHAPEDLRAPHAHAHHEYPAPRALRMPSRSPSPPPPRVRSPAYASPRYQPAGPGQPSQRSPPYADEWERREHHREWERGGREREREYPPPAPQPQQQHPGYRASPPPPRRYSPAPSPHVHARTPAHWNGAGRSPPHHEPAPRRYDPLWNERAPAPERERTYADASPEPPRSVSHAAGTPQPRMAAGPATDTDSARPTPTPAPEGARKRKSAKEKEAEAAMQGPGQEPAPKKERKRRAQAKKPKEDGGVLGLPPMGVAKAPSKGTPEPSTSNGSVASTRPSPPGPAPQPPSRVVDEDYDEPGVADALMGLSAYRAPDAPAAPLHSPRPSLSARESASSGASRSPPSRAGSGTLKRPLSPGPDEGEHKRTRIDALVGKASPPTSTSANAGRRTPVPSTRPSPIPFRTHLAASRSPEQQQPPASRYAASPALPPVLPPHPKPYGLSSAGGGGKGAGVSLPPIATLSSTPSPKGSEDRMQVDSRHSASPAHSKTPSPTSSRHSRHGSQGGVEAAA
ncbi:hypothetical protein HWV62_17708 [Athelia sp. TMB]|nr:hypothetical protein HWV62_17708 [Athelia sp. TMB]